MKLDYIYLDKIYHNVDTFKTGNYTLKYILITYVDGREFKASILETHDNKFEKLGYYTDCDIYDEPTNRVLTEIGHKDGHPEYFL